MRPVPLFLCLLLVALPAALAFRPARAAAADPQTLDKFFHGKVTAIDGKNVTLRYDFRQKDQLKDWIDRVPFRIQPRKDQGIKWFDEKLEIIGNSGARHLGEWMGDILVEATFTPDMEKDFGGYLSPVSETEDFVTYTFVETYFHAFDKSAGGTNSIIKFGAQWREGDSSEDFIGFRYGPRKPPRKALEIGKPIRASFGRQKRKLVFVLPDQELKGAEKGKRLKRFHCGFYAIKGRLLLDNVEITGQLSSDWLKRNNIELKTSVPIGSVDDAVDPATQKLLDEHAQGSRKATRGLVDLLKDETLGPTVKEAVITALSSGSKRAVRYAMDLLYHPRVPVRECGITVIKALLGKDYGFKAKASEKSRSAALKKLNKDLQDNPGLLED